MSLFTDLVVKAERRKLRARDGAMPLIEVSREYEQRLLKALLALAGMWFALVVFMGGSKLIHIGEEGFFFKNELTPFFVGLLFVLTLAFVALGALMAREAIDQASNARIKAREAKAAKVAAEEARKAAEAAEAARRQALVLAEQDQRQRAIFEFRVQALRQMENGVKELLFDHRERAEWIPERADEEHLFEMIRKRFTAASRDVPELGILRRSTDPLIIMILGNRTCLPAEPSDEVLARRQLPPVAKLLR